VGGDPQLGQHRREELTSWLSHIAVLPGDEAVAVTWGRLSAAAVQRGRSRPVNDMWVAACCLTHGIPLATLNLKDYEDFEQYHGLRILGRE
jgi:predicted nucleic acid-binding protein